MSLLDPQTREEVDSSGWGVLILAIVAMLLPMVFWNRFFLTPEAFVHAARISLVAGPLLGWLAHRRARRILERGIHPQFSKRFPPPRGSVFSMYFAMVLLTWLLAVIVIAVVSALRTPTTERVFTIVDTDHCTRKCLGCREQVRLLDWPGLYAARVCGDTLRDLRVGTKVVVQGKFEGLVIRVDGIRGWVEK